MKPHSVRTLNICLITIVALGLITFLCQKSIRFTSDAQAQNNSGYEVVPINGFSVSGLQNVISLGDGKSFVVFTNDKFMVYQVRSK